MRVATLLAPNLVQQVAKRFPQHAVVGAAGWLRGTTAVRLKEICAEAGVKTASDLAARQTELERRLLALPAAEHAAIGVAFGAWFRSLLEARIGSTGTVTEVPRDQRGGGVTRVGPHDPHGPPDDREAAFAWARARGVEKVLSLPFSALDRVFERGSGGTPLEAIFLPLRAPLIGPTTSLLLAELRAMGREQLVRAAQLRTSRLDERALRSSALLPVSSLAPPLAEVRAKVQALAAKMIEAGVERSWMSVGYPIAMVRFVSAEGGRFEVTADTRHGRLVRLPLAALSAGTFDPLALPPGADAGFREDTLAALDAVSDFLRDATSPDAQAARAWLEVPPWSRTLARATALDAATVQRGVSGERLAFRVALANGHFRLVDVLAQAPRKEGGFSAGRRVSAANAAPLAATSLEGRLLDAVGELEARDWHVVTPSDGRRVTALLSLLAGHPCVLLDGDPPLPLRVRRANVTITLSRVEASGGGAGAAGGPVGYAVGFAAAGQAVSATELAEARLPDGTAALVDSSAGRLALVPLVGTVATLVVALAELPAAFPEESLDALLGLLSRAQEGAEVSVPDELLGRPVDADARSVVRLELAANGALYLDLRVRPIIGGALLEPGRGSTRVFGLDTTGRISAHRRLEQEREAAERLLAELPLGEATRSDAWSLRVDDLDEAADVVVALGDRPDVAVEWASGGALSVVRIGRRDLRLHIDKKHDWFSIAGGVEIDGTRVELAALLAAARAGHRFVRISPQQIVALGKDLRDRLRDLDDTVQAGPNGIEASAFAVAALDALVEDEAQIRAVHEWTAARARWLRAATYEPALPTALTATLRSYQQDGFRWLARLAEWSPGACLADDMGLGKTVQTLALLLHRSELGPTLVVAPTTVGPNWLVEAARFAPTLRVRSYRGTERTVMLRDLGPGDVLVTSYDILIRDIELLKVIPLGTLVLDEAQAIKNAASRRAAAVRDLTAAFRLALTGTPIENHLGELWSLFRAIAPSRLGSLERFRERFALPIERDRDPERRRALAHVVQPFLLRRTKAVVAPELPARTETVRLVTLSPGERDRYETERLAAIAAMQDADPATGRFAILAAITRLRRLACNVKLVDPTSTLPSEKLKQFLELAAELREAGHRALVFSQFTSHLALIRAALDARGAKSLYLDGQTPQAERQRLVAAFQAGEGDFFLLSLKAGGTGINLTAADYVVHLDPWWNPAAEDQATDRAHRIGQIKPVTVVRLVAAGTIEEAVLALHAEKRELAESLLAGKDLAAKLSAKELIDLVRAGEAATRDLDEEIATRGELVDVADDEDG